MIPPIMHQSESDSSPLRILHLEDSEIDHELVRIALCRTVTSFEIERVDSLDGFTSQLVNRAFDVILADYRLPGFTALDAWERTKPLANHPPFILLSGAIGEPAAVSAIKMGISDYLAKDDLGRLGQVIRRAIEVAEVRHAKEMADAELAKSERQLAQFNEHLQATIEQERASIAREIHDDIGGALAAIRFDLSWIGRHTRDESTLEHVATATEMLQHAIGASQRIMMNLRPAVLDQGLNAAIQWLASGFSKRTGIRTDVHSFDEKNSLPKPVQMVAYRIAQEAMTNIFKHAQCDRVTIDLTDSEDVLTMEITDNGKGLSPSDLEKPKSFGIRGLHERAKTVGGWVDVSSAAGRGTSITLSVPLARPTTTDEKKGE
jgi:two-component system, NarL family, sensor histidine kinase UhpB